MPTITLQPDAAAGKDAYLATSSPTTNYGTNPLMAVGFQSGKSSFTYRGIIEFDLTSIPSGAYVKRSILTMVTSIAAATASPSHIKRLDTAWSEGTATWNAPWTTAGGDFVSDDEVAFNLPTATGTLDIDITDLVQDAIANRSGILSLILKRDTEALGTSFVFFHTSDAAAEDDRPQLEVCYGVPRIPVLTAAMT